MKSPLVYEHSIEEEIRLIKNGLVRITALVKAKFPLHEDWCGYIEGELKGIRKRVYLLDEEKMVYKKKKVEVERPW